MLHKCIFIILKRRSTMVWQHPGLEYDFSICGQQGWTVNGPHIRCDLVSLCFSAIQQLLAVSSPGSLSPPFPPLIPLVLVYCCCCCLPLQGPEDLAPHPLSTGSQLISAVLPLEHLSSSPPRLLVHLTFLCRCRRVFELTTKTFSLTCIQAPHGFHSEVGNL